MPDYAITVSIEGLPPNDNEYDEDRYLAQFFRVEVELVELWKTGARAENIEEAISQALTEAVIG